MAFSYSGPSVAAALLVGAFNENLATAKDRLARTDEYMASALASIGAGPPPIQEAGLGSSISIPSAPAIGTLTASEIQGLFRGTSNEIQTTLVNGLSNFFTTYFPLGAEMAATQAWLARVLTEGGTGLDPAIEDQIWQRDRARLLKDAARATAEATAAWAGRGYPLPPGALLGVTQRIDQDAREKIAESSRTRAIEQARTELENIKFAVEQAADLRKAAVSAASDYLRVLALGPQVGAQIASATADARSKFAEATTRAYSAEISALELPVRMAIADAGFGIDARKANLAAATAIIEARTRTVQAAAQSVGQQAASALNALSGHASLSGSEHL